MTNSSDFRPADWPIYVAGTAGTALTVTFTGVSVTQVADWALYIRHNSYDTATLVASPTITVDTGANTVTWSLTATQVAALMSTGQTKFSGYWHLQHVAADRCYIAGRVIVDRAATQTSTSGSVAVTVTSTTVSLTVTNAISTAAVTSAATVVDRRANLAKMRPWHRAIGKRGVVPADVFVIGDSITEGWSSAGGTAPISTADGYFGECQRLVSQALNTHGYHGTWIPAGSGWYPPGLRFSAEPDVDREAALGLSLRARIIQPGDAAATCTMTTDRIIVHWRKRNFFTGSIKIKIDGSTVLTADTFDGSLTAFDSSLQVFDSGALTRGSHTLSVEQDSGGLGQPIVFDGAYFCDGDYAAGVRFWNASHFGYGTASYNTAGHQTWLDGITGGSIKPGLVVMALGTNDADPAVYATNTSAMIDAVWAAATTAGTVRPSIAILIPPAAGSRTEAANEVYRNYAYTIASTKVDSTGAAGVDVWEWDEAQGGVSRSTGDPLAVTSDNIHPLGGWHRSLGSYLAGKMLEDQSPLTAAIELQRQIDAGGTGGSFSLVRTAVKTANYSAAAGDLVPVDTTSGSVTVTLPTAPTDKSLVEVKQIVRGGTNTVTVACGGSDHFNIATSGPTSRTLTLASESILVMYQASTAVWTVLTTDTPLAALDGRFAPITGSATYATQAQTVNLVDTAGDSLTGTADNTLGKLAKGTAFQVRRMNSAANAEEWASGGMHLIAETVLGSDTASIDFSSIPATFRHLRILFAARSDKAAVDNDSMVLSINNDTTDANYNRNRTQDGTSAAAYAAAGSRFIAGLPAATSPANYFTIGTIDIPHYTAAVFKAAVSKQMFARSASNTPVVEWNLQWLSTTAINRLTFTPSGGTNLLTGTRISLYGIG